MCLNCPKELQKSTVFLLKYIAFQLHSHIDIFLVTFHMICQFV